MFILAATTSSLEVLLAGAIATNQLPFVTSYADLTTTTFTAGSLTGQSNSTTAVTIVAAPGASTQRQVKSINVFNADTVSATVTIRYNENSTFRIIVKATLATGESLIYTQDAGWQVIQANGGIKTGSPVALTTKGDLLVFDTGTTRLAVGTDGQVLLADSASTPGIKWFTHQDGDSIQLNGTSKLEVRKLRDVAGDPGSPVAGEVWYNTTSKNPRVKDDAIGNADIERNLYSLTTATASAGGTTTGEVTFDSNAQFTFPANSLAVGQVYRLVFGGSFVHTSVSTETIRFYLGASAGTGVTVTQVSSNYGGTREGANVFYLRVTAAGATSQIRMWSSSINSPLTVSFKSDFSGTFDNTGAIVFSISTQYAVSNASSGSIIDLFELERIH